MGSLDRRQDDIGWRWGRDRSHPLIEAISMCAACDNVDRGSTRCTRLFATMFESNPTAIMITAASTDWGR
jgi:hypothetical protein